MSSDVTTLSSASGQNVFAGVIIGGVFGFGALAVAPVLLTLGWPLLQSVQTVGIPAYLAIGPMFVGYLLFGIGM